MDGSCLYLVRFRSPSGNTGTSLFPLFIQKGVYALKMFLDHHQYMKSHYFDAGHALTGNINLVHYVPFNFFVTS